MYLEAKETARLYTLLSDKLGSDTTEAMFKYIDNKTERAVENTIQSLATKQDIMDVRKEAAENKSELIKTVVEAKSENTNLMFVFWVGQVGLILALSFLRK